MRVAALAQEFSDAFRALAHLRVTEPPPGERASLAGYRVSMFNLALRPLIAAIAALVLYVFLSWNVIQGLNITNPGVYVLSAFLAGFSERYFLRIVRTATEPAAERKQDRDDD